MFEQGDFSNFYFTRSIIKVDALFEMKFLDVVIILRHAHSLCFLMEQA